LDERIAMTDLDDGQTVEMKGSGAKPYVLKNTGGVYSCTCPAWRNQSVGIEQRTCKHLRKLRGDAAEDARVGASSGGSTTNAATKKSPKSATATAEGTGAEGEAGESGPPLLLAHPWDNAQDLSGWWMSEKLDGVRAYWDGAQILSRQGNLFHTPTWFTEHLPKQPLDGELWLDRKAFQRTVSIVRRQDRSDEHWKSIRLVVFDSPASAEPFESRIEGLRDWFASAQPPWARLLEQQRCQSVDHLRRELDRIDQLGGEGLMLREPGSRYEVGRSTTLLKVKRFHDAEAIVIGHQPGKGRHKGRLGALTVKLPTGIEFSVGTGFSDRERQAPPAIGTTITFRYQELTDGGVPRFPSFVRQTPNA
jgi:DNA ligase 1